MEGRKQQRILIVFFITLCVLFTLLKVVVTIEGSKFRDYNAQSVASIERIISIRKTFSFIVVGDVQNSRDVFDKKLIPLINESGADFIVFLGDSLIDGTNVKYGIFYKTLLKLHKPALITVGDKEVSDGGTKNYFKHAGPLTFFFIAGESEFVFLDTTGHTSEEWQINWIRDLLSNIENVANRFVFMNRTLLLDNDKLLELGKKYRMSESYKNYLFKEFSDKGVSTVFSSSNGKYDLSTIGGVDYLASGGGGGELLYNNPKSFFHCVKIDVNNGSVSYSLIKPEERDLSPGLTMLEYFGFQLLSWVYLYYVNVLFIVSILFIVIYFVYSRLSVRIDYYPHLSESIEKKYPLKIVMFTNNYLPFIGGVPLSLSRLKQGLEKSGHQVFIFAPRYEQSAEEEKGVFRCAPLFHYKKGDLIAPVSNIFSSKIKKEFKRINPDIVHVHHPFWLGGVGRRLARKYKKPIVFTYHTRLEQYNHYVPVFHRLAGGQIPHMIIKEFASACDAVVAPTITAKRYLRNLGIGKMVIVQPTGVDLSLFCSSQSGFNLEKNSFTSDTELMLFSVFRLSKEKNPYFFLDGMERLIRLSPRSFKCYIAGTGPEEKTMKKYITLHGLEKHVFLLGKISPEEIPSYYRMADLFVFSSQSETQGMVILEAMAGGCPVVAVDSSGISDIIKNGINGYKTGSNLDEWVVKIRLLLENEEERLRLGRQALRTAEENSIDAMTGNILEMYYEIIDWKKRHPYQTFIR